jgi:FAD:protein FMN transferase
MTVRHLETVMGVPMSVDIRTPSGRNTVGRDTGQGSDGGEGDPGRPARPAVASGGPAVASAVRAAFDLLHEADHRFSTYRDDSEVALVNRGRLASEDYSDDLREVLSIAADFARRSGGAFTAQPPGRPLDVNGVVKGWAVQRAADLLARLGVHTFCFNAGGDVVVRGTPPGRVAWNVAVRSPTDASARLAVLAVTDGAVATSGSYERGAHILDGRTGRIPAELTSVTVLAPSLTTADVLATAVFALGRDGVPWAIDNGATGVLALTAAGDLLGAGVLPFAS